MNESKIEKAVIARGYRYCGSAVATSEDVERGNLDRYSPRCEEGDLLVALCGYDAGSVEWWENWGPAYA